MFFKFKKNIRHYVDNQYERDEWVEKKLKILPMGDSIIDAGCGSQKYRKFCGQLKYTGQDFGQVTKDERQGFAGLKQEYEYGCVDIVGDIWDIPVKDKVFDVVLCTEVFEHIPYPNETLKEFSRILKPGGKLILTAPFACLRHMDPYFFYSGFSDRWYEYFLKEYGFKLLELKPQGDYNKWMAVENFRTINNSRWFKKILIAPLLLPALIYYYIASKYPTPMSVSTLVGGYFIYAEKYSDG